MLLSKKLQPWVDKGIITKEQAEKIIESNKNQHFHLAWSLMFWIAGLLIGSGVILLTGSNWEEIPDVVKLLSDFAIWIGLIYALDRSFLEKQNRLKELYLTFCFLFVGATIGLIGQIFNLDGGWQSFAIAWAILSLPFILLSKIKMLNVLWLVVLISGINLDGYIVNILEHFIKKQPITAIISGTMFLGLLSYAGEKLSQACKEKIVLPQAFSDLAFWGMYFVAVVLGLLYGTDEFTRYDFTPVLANICVFVFLGIRLLMAVKNKDAQSFIRNTHIAKISILFVFLSRFGNLFTTGIGFILGGFILLLILYGVKKTSKHIKQFEAFK